MIALSKDCQFDSESSLKRMIRAGYRAFVLLPWSARLCAAGKIALAVLREIFDESAYERFLCRHGLNPSAATYAAFCCEHQSVKSRRPRCC